MYHHTNPCVPNTDLPLHTTWILHGSCFVFTFNKKLYLKNIKYISNICNYTKFQDTILNGASEVGHVDNTDCCGSKVGSNSKMFTPSFSSYYEVTGIPTYLPL
jgi:hypothetical protein